MQPASHGAQPSPTQTSPPHAPIRGTQSFVYTLTECWRRPSLTLLEIAWRWLYGIPVILLLYRYLTAILAATPLNIPALQRMSLLDPLAAAATLADAAALLLPPLLSLSRWLAPLLLLTWIIVSSFGRTLVLRRTDPALRARPFTLMALQAIRVVALAATFAIWFRAILWAASVAVTGPIARQQEPSLVQYCTIVILSTLGLFTLWAVASWGLSIAPLLAMLRNLAVLPSLRAAFQLGPLKAKLVEINLVMGIVKIALIVLAMVFSATPLPFESVTTPGFLHTWWAGVTVFYLIASDFFHVARLVAYLQLWRAYEIPAESSTSAPEPASHLS